MAHFKVQYWYGSYTGYEHVNAEDRDDAIRKVQKLLKPFMTLPMAYVKYAAAERSEKD